MAATLAQIARERKAYLRKLNSLQLRFDRSQERMEKKIKTILRRKRAVPEQKDILEIAQLFSAMIGEMRSFEQLLNKGFPL